MFPERLKELIDVRGTSQAALARKLDITRQCITRWMMGDTLPRGERLKHLALALDVTVSDLWAPVGAPLNAEPVYTVEERLLLRVWRTLDADGRAAMLAVGQAA